jgi:anthranilate synthase component 1
MLDLTPATFDDFEREALSGNVVPVVRSVLADLQTPVGAFLRIAGDAPYAFLLESIEGGERVARYSFLGVNPWMVARGRGGQTVVEKSGEREVRDCNAVEFLRQYFAGKRLAGRAGLAPLSGGAVGYLAYDAARWFEPVLDLNGGAPHAETNDAVWMFCRTILAFDRVRQQMEITSVVFTDEAEGDRDRLRELYERAIAETASIESDLSREATMPLSRRPESEQAKVEFQSNWPRLDFEAAVGKVKEHILAGDCYQAVIAQQFTKPTAADPLSIYRALRSTNPSPYMYFLRLGAETISGASPEMLVRCHDQRLDYRPIAGTRKRGANDAEDARLADEMRAD